MTQLKGEKFQMQIEKVTQVRISSEKVKELLSQEDLKKVCSELKFEQVKTNRIEGKKKQFKVPNLANMTAEGLVDLLGELREEAANLKKLEGVYKEALQARIKEKKAEQKRLKELEKK